MALRIIGAAPRGVGPAQSCAQAIQNGSDGFFEDAGWRETPTIGAQTARHATRGKSPYAKLFTCCESKAKVARSGQRRRELWREPIQRDRRSTAIRNWRDRASRGGSWRDTLRPAAGGTCLLMQPRSDETVRSVFEPRRSVLPAFDDAARVMVLRRGELRGAERRRVDHFAVEETCDVANRGLVFDACQRRRKHDYSGHQCGDRGKSCGDTSRQDHRKTAASWAPSTEALVDANVAHPWETCSRPRACTPRRRNLRDRGRAQRFAREHLSDVEINKAVANDGAALATMLVR